jgi:spermidine/putrescine-binding protein
MYQWGMLTGNGQDATKWTQDDLAEIKAYGMEEWKNAKTTTSTTGEQIDLLVRGDVVLVTDGWNYIESEAQNQGVDVKCVVPEGPVKTFVDAYFILDGAKNIDASYEWLNYAFDPQVQAQLAKNVGTAVASQGSYAFMDPELAEGFQPETLNQIILNAELNVLPDLEPEPPFVSIDDLYKTMDEIKATVQ